MMIGGNIATTKTTSYKVVVPFYLFAAFALLAASALLLYSHSSFLGHHFQPSILAITHLMALGWGTMIILGASHQLVPVVVEGKLYSETLANLTFWLSAIGIIFLVYGFYNFNLNFPSKFGGTLIILAFFVYFINLTLSIAKGKSRNIHATFVITAAFWLLATISLGYLLVFNFEINILPKPSLHYLPLHVHLGVVGWFLLLVIGVASRLIPMFLISKYQNKKLLTVIYFMINFSLIIYITTFFYSSTQFSIIFCLMVILAAILLFCYYCYKAYKNRIRKKVDESVNTSLMSVLQMIIPFLLLLITIFIQFNNTDTKWILVYGFLIFFGWITAIIFGMTFKTLPFVIWNKVYHHFSSTGNTPNPKDLFNNLIYRIMLLTYFTGILTFLAGIILRYEILLQGGAFILMLTAFLYNWNIAKIILHKAK